MDAILFIQNHEQREFKKTQNTWLSFFLTFPNFSQSFSTFAFSNFFSLFSLCWYINVKYSVWLRSEYTFHLLEPFMKFSNLYFNIFIIFIHRHIQSSYWFYISTLGCHGLLRISNNLSSSLSLGSYRIKYQILTGYSFQIVFYVPEVSIEFISWEVFTVALPPHHWLDQGVRGYTGTG